MTGRTTMPLRAADLRWVRVACGALTAIVLLLTVSAIPLRYGMVQAPDATIRAPEFRDLIKAGVEPRLVATIDVAVVSIQSICLIVSGLALLLRRSTTREVVYLAITLIVFGAAFSGLVAVHRTPGPVLSQSTAGIVATVVAFLGSALPWNAMFWLPQGRFVSRWTTAWASVQVLLLAGLYFLVPFPRSHDLVNLVGVAVVILGIYAQLSHYRQVQDPATRQQIKWAVVGICTIATGFLIGQVTLLAVGDSAGLAPRLVAVLARLVIASSQIGLVVCLAIAIQRYHLWHVDLVINRSLVYGGVTIALLVVFAGGGFVLQRVLGEDRAGLAFAVSIAAAMLAFGPARLHAQRFVDRRLFGLRFDLVELGQARRLPDVRNPGALTGRMLGRYRLLGVLGRGGMGEVYHGDVDGQRFAIKIVANELGGQSEFLRWLERESQALAALNHRNIVRFHEASESAGIHYLVLEFIEGLELSAIIRQRRRLPLTEVRQVVADCAAALQYAHDCGLVHRDIKPSNIMVRQAPSGDAEAVLMDFGVAKIRDGRTALTNTGVVGTIQYMAPEQILAERTVDSRADIYALGVTVYEMLTGELPFKGNPGQLVFAHLHEQPPDPRTLVPDLPADVAGSVMRALAKRAEQRFPTAHEFAAAFGV